MSDKERWAPANSDQAELDDVLSAYHATNLSIHGSKIMRRTPFVMSDVDRAAANTRFAKEDLLERIRALDFSVVETYDEAERQRASGLAREKERRALEAKEAEWKRSYSDVPLERRNLESRMGLMGGYIGMAVGLAVVLVPILLLVSCVLTGNSKMTAEERQACDAMAMRGRTCSAILEGRR